jgi:hypothetical protein
VLNTCILISEPCEKIAMIVAISFHFVSQIGGNRMDLIILFCACADGHPAAAGVENTRVGQVTSV